EDVHLRILHRTSHEQPDVQRAGAIIHAPQHQRRSRNPWELGGQVLSGRRGSRVDSDGLRVDARLVARPDHLLGGEALVEHHRTDDLFHLPVGRAAFAAIVLSDELHTLHRHRREETIDRRRAAYHDQRFDARRKIDRRLDGDLSAVTVADERSLRYAQLPQQLIHHVRVEGERLSFDGQAAGFAEIHQVNQQQAVVAHERWDVGLEVTPTVCARATSMQTHERRAFTDLVVVNPHFGELY